MDTYDVVVIGAGVNGLVAAAELGTAGWSVALVEQNSRLGGFIDSGEATLPGYTHDTYSSWHPLFVSGGAYAALGPDLHEHGLEYANTDGALTGSISAGRAAVAYRDAAKTVEGFTHPEDQAAYLAMLEEMGERANLVFRILGSEVRSAATVKLALSALKSQKIKGMDALARDAVMSGRAFGRDRFTGSEPDQLWAPWLLHAGISPDSATGGMMIPVLAMTMHGFGLPVVTGGAKNFVTAFERLLSEHGVTVLTGHRAERVTTTNGRATGVVTDKGLISARRAVIASVTPQALYGTLLKDEPVPWAIRRDAERFRFGRAAMQIHIALDRPLRWTDERFQDVPLLHISDGSGGTGIACAQADAGALPAAPTIVVGRQHVLDQSRVPEGAGSLWLQLQEVPWQPTADSAGAISVDGTWNADTTRRYVERVLARIEEHAPDLTSSILETTVITPTDLAAANPNAVHGDPYGGSMELDQNLLWRPLAHSGKHTTAIKGLLHIGASTHPGGGLSGGAGHLAAQSLLSANNRRSLISKK